MMGGGKYQFPCTMARAMCGARGVILIVFEGDSGSGYSAQLPPEVCGELPAILREIAERIEQDVRSMQGKGPAGN